MATDNQKTAWGNYVKTVLGPRASLLKPFYPTAEMPQLLHISSDGGIKKFTPMVSKRTANKEDRTVPRVSTAPHLMGCINGYCEVIGDFLEYGTADWKGGYTIYGIPFDIAGSPHVDLVVDVKDTDEKWVIPYDHKHREITPTKLGKFFVKGVYYENCRGDNRLYSFTAFIHVTTPQRIYLTEKVFLPQGYYRLQISNSSESFQFKSDTISFNVITRAEYMEAKGVTAGLLSYTAPAPSDQW